MSVKESLNERSEVNRRFLHRVVTGIRDERKVDIRIPNSERLSQVVLLKSGKILSTGETEQPRLRVPTSRSRRIDWNGDRRRLACRYSAWIIALNFQSFSPIIGERVAGAFGNKGRK